MDYRENLEHSLMQLKYSVDTGENLLDSEDINNLFRVFINQENEIANKDDELSGKARRIEELEEYVVWLKDELSEFKNSYQEVKG